MLLNMNVKKVAQVKKVKQIKMFNLSPFYFKLNQYNILKPQSYIYGTCHKISNIC